MVTLCPNEIKTLKLSSFNWLWKCSKFVGTSSDINFFDNIQKSL